MKSGAVEAYHAAKYWVIEGSGLDKDALHIYAGLVVFLTVSCLRRGPRAMWFAWAAVLIAALGAEWFDLAGEELRRRIQSDASHWHDIWNTMFWPTVLVVLSRWWRLERRASGEDAERSHEQT